MPPATVAVAVPLFKPKQLTDLLFKVIEIAGVFCTVTICLHELVRQLMSFTIHITDVFPTGNCAGALFVKFSIPQLSLTI